MRVIAFCLLVLSYLLTASQDAWGAFVSAKDQAAPDADWNPRPLPDDIVLPMPCGQFLALRAVAIPSGALIRDKAFAMGIANSQNGDRQIYERQFTGHIAAPFTIDNLPDEWRQKLTPQKGEPASETWYLIGKYEISRQQWDSVMRAVDVEGDENPGMCPTPGARGGNLPIMGVSWYDAQDFLSRYNAWLIKNHVESLPAFPGTRNVAFFRLPTEEEWEYAARGGANVPPEWWEEKDIFPFEKDRGLSDYGVFTHGVALTGAAPIGSRHPNPLGIHDTIGNAREMVDGFFRMSIADMRQGRVERRLHGASGGILTKGGSFRSEGDAVMPGWRDEIPLFTAKGPGRAADLGLRLVLSGLNIPDARRLDTLRGEEQNLPSPSESASKSIDLAGKKTPLEALDAISENADTALRDSLRQLRAMIEDTENARAMEDSRKLESAFRSLLYQAETLRAFAFRYVTVKKDIDKINKVISESTSEENRAKARNLIQQGKKDMRDYLHSLEMGAKHYKASLEAIANERPSALDSLVDQIGKEYGGDSVFAEHMRQNLHILEKYLQMTRRSGEPPSLKTILAGIIPERHFNALPVRKE